MGTAALIARRKAGDYDIWRAACDSLEGPRQQPGCFGAEMMTGPVGKNDVFVVRRFPAIEAAQGYVGSTELKEAMSRAGLAGPSRTEIAVEA